MISPLQSLVFIGHLISIGLTSDRFLNFPPLLVAGVGALSEGLQDLSFLTSEDDHHGHENDDGHDHGNLLRLPLQVIFSPILLIGGIFYWFFNRNRNSLSFFKAIEQTFELPLLNIVFFPLLAPGAIWHWAFKKESNDLTFYQSIKLSFDIHSHDHKTPEQALAPKELSPEWREKEYPKWILNKAKNRLGSAQIDKETALEKQACLKKLSSKNELEDVIKQLKEGKEIGKVLSQAGEEPVANGYNNKHSEEARQRSYNDILYKKRTFFNFFKTYTAPTTPKMVKKAFRLVRASG